MDSELLILGSAHRHGVPDEDIQHALRDIVATYDVGEGMTMVIGPDRTGVLIEVGVVESYDALCAVHAMRPVRERFFGRR